ncbi:MAG: hypothetical protein IH921_00745 [Gemmatimonadetes bacterium]|nr:hypothetical protein [Gemmatimonadota bacterium]
MTRVLGIMAGVGILVLAGFAWDDSATGWSAGHSDIGFWWAVIATFLTIAGLGAMIGTWLHTQPIED